MKGVRGVERKIGRKRKRKKDKKKMRITKNV